jgi:hypothetical protein
VLQREVPDARVRLDLGLFHIRSLLVAATRLRARRCHKKRQVDFSTDSHSGTFVQALDMRPNLETLDLLRVVY